MGELPCVLIVDDDDTVRHLIAAVLGQAGFRVLEASCGGDALSTLEQENGSVHLVIADIAMPGMSGLELGERIPTVAPASKVAYMSGFADQTFTYDGTHFIRKPFHPDEMVHFVRDVLDGK